jgi:hypothetical protein
VVVAEVRERLAVKRKIHQNSYGEVQSQKVKECYCEEDVTCMILLCIKFLVANNNNYIQMCGSLGSILYVDSNSAQETH